MAALQLFIYRSASEDLQMSPQNFVRVFVYDRVDG